MRLLTLVAVALVSCVVDVRGGDVVVVPKKEHEGDAQCTVQRDRIEGGEEKKALAGRIYERTLVIVKPDGLQRCLVSEVMRRFEGRGFKLVGLKMAAPSADKIRVFYREHEGKHFFKRLIDTMVTLPLVLMVWEGIDVVDHARKTAGSTKPSQALPGTLRGDYGINELMNLVHCSDSVESAHREIALWFDENELVSWHSAVDEFMNA